MLSLMMLGCLGCEWQFNLGDDVHISIERYDRIQSLYLMTSDFSALQQMNTIYPMQTRTLIEDVLHIGQVNDPEINTKFLHFYQDSTLQTLISEAEQQYANLDDINEELTTAFRYLKNHIPNLEIPEIYVQIGSLDQSVIVGNGLIGICLDKYLGSDFPLYQKPEYGYSAEQLEMMCRSYIVPDCIGFYLLSLYPVDNGQLSQEEIDMYMGRIQWVVNKAIGRTVFRNSRTQEVEQYMKNHKNLTLEALLGS